MQARRAAEGLRTAETITEAIYDAGFDSSSRFYESAAARLGMTPGAVRRGGAGAEIRFAIGQASLGAVLVAATDKGVCAITLGDDPSASRASFRIVFRAPSSPAATRVRADGGAGRRPDRGAGPAPRPAARHPRHRVPGAGLAGAPRHPPGQDGDLRRDRPRGRPPEGGARGGYACAANPLAVAIPCHRVVRTDGDVSGYRWGVERKRALIAREAA